MDKGTMPGLLRRLRRPRDRASVAQENVASCFQTYAQKIFCSDKKAPLNVLIRIASCSNAKQRIPPFVYDASLDHWTTIWSICFCSHLSVQMCHRLCCRVRAHACEMVEAALEKFIEDTERSRTELRNAFTCTNKQGRSGHFSLNSFPNPIVNHDVTSVYQPPGPRLAAFKQQKLRLAGARSEGVREGGQIHLHGRTGCGQRKYASWHRTSFGGWMSPTPIPCRPLGRLGPAAPASGAGIAESMGRATVIAIGCAHTHSPSSRLRMRPPCAGRVTACASSSGFKV